MTTPDQRAADLAERFTAFAPRLETSWFTCERQEPVGTTVRYVVRAKDEAQTVLGEIAWSHRHHCYTVTLVPATWELVAKCLQDLGEICTYLNARQRRLKATQQRPEI